MAIQNGRVYWTVTVRIFIRKGGFLADLCFLDFLSGFEYNKLELLWITIATYR